MLKCSNGPWIWHGGDLLRFRWESCDWRKNIGTIETKRRSVDRVDFERSLPEMDHTILQIYSFTIQESLDNIRRIKGLDPGVCCCYGHQRSVVTGSMGVTTELWGDIQGMTSLVTTARRQRKYIWWSQRIRRIDGLGSTAFGEERWRFRQCEIYFNKIDFLLPSRFWCCWQRCIVVSRVIFNIFILGNRLRAMMRLAFRLVGFPSVTLSKWCTIGIHFCGFFFYFPVTVILLFQ